MASGFPGSIDNFTDPLTTSALNSPSHAGQHQDLNDAVEKIETYMGLVKVIPTSATNGTVGATGTVTIGNAVSSVTVSGAFSSLYDNYRILVSGGTFSTTSDLQLQLGSTTANYRYQYIYGTLSSSLVAAGSTGTSSFPFVGIGGATQILADISIVGPFGAFATFVNCHAGRAGNYLGTFTGVQVDSTSFTSFVLFPNTGTMTGGSIRVYGYRN